MTHLIQALDASGVTMPRAVAGYRAGKASRNAVHDTLDGGVGVAYRVAALRAGTLTLAYSSRPDAWAAFVMFGRACPYEYSSDVAVVGMRFAVDGTISIEQDRAVTDVWYVDVPYQEVSS